MKLRVLGCYSPYPPADGAGPGYLLETTTTKVLLDCGSGVVSQLGRVCDLTNGELSAVILSHLHADHFCDLLVLRYARFLSMRAGKATPLAVYAPSKPDLERASLPFLDTLSISTIQQDSSLSISEMKFDFAGTLHPYPALAIKATVDDRSMVYTGDTAWHDDLVDFCRGTDTLLAEASFLEQNKGTNVALHLSARDAGRLAQMAGVKRLVLTHFHPAASLDLLLAEAEAQFAGEITLASTGLVLDI